MTHEQELEKLRSLLERVRANRSRPRAVAAPTDGDGAAEVELLDAEDVVELTAAAPSEPPELEVTFEEEREEPPVSSRRPIAMPSPMDEALAGAAQQFEAPPEREIPVKTPPPESGPQAAVPVELPAEPRLPEMEGLREELAARPTTAQIGQTVELEAPTRAGLELSSERPRAPVPVADELEAELPRAQAKPVERERAKAELPSPEITRRVAPAQTVEAKAVSAHKTFQPRTFAELLDASLKLLE
ncbi:MAG TPA: hypothetical protein VGJ84_21845 [Polyangiaceae bacterium]